MEVQVQEAEDDEFELMAEQYRGGKFKTFQQKNRSAVNNQQV